MAIWQQSDGARDNIWANRYVAGVGWGLASKIETHNAGDVWYSQVAPDPSGNAVEVWMQSDGRRTNIWAIPLPALRRERMKNVPGFA